MRICSQKMELAMARAGLNSTDLRHVLSSATITKIRKYPEHEVNPKTVGKLARALNVDVVEIIEQEADPCSQR